ncbi:MAG: hypothetical protein JW751_11040 [Polyangiaceae bacterium]|nr:hypothetical protein [Polyangiaceae bacterium]
MPGCETLDAVGLVKVACLRLDSCAVDRQIDVSVPATDTLTVPYVLDNSCD